MSENVCGWVRLFDTHCSIVQMNTNTQTDIDRAAYLVVKLVIEEVFPQSVRKVEDSCDDDTKRTRQREEEVERVIVLACGKNASQFTCCSNGTFVE